MVHQIDKNVTSVPKKIDFQKLWHVEACGFLHLVLQVSFYQLGKIQTQKQMPSMKINKQRKNRNGGKKTC